MHVLKMPEAARFEKGYSSNYLICLVQQVKENLKKKCPTKYHVVLNFEHIMLMRGTFRYSEENIKSCYPDITAFRVSYAIENSNYLMEDLYLLYPNFDLLILTILSWEGWTVDFFSENTKALNEVFLKEILQSIVDKTNDQTLVDLFQEHGVLRVFSSDHMVSTKYQYKDLRVIFGDLSTTEKDNVHEHSVIENAILVDSNFSYVIPSQLPMITVQRDVEFAERFEFNFDEDLGEQEESTDALENKAFKQWYHPIDNASFIMGIVLKCKQLIDNQTQLTLKEALIKVLRRKHTIQTLNSERLGSSLRWSATNRENDHDHNRDDNSLFWIQYYLNYLSQPCRFDHSLGCIRKNDTSFTAEYNQFIEIGENYFFSEFADVATSSKHLGIKLCSL
jgi:hypothetical protein